MPRLVLRAALGRALALFLLQIGRGQDRQVPAEVVVHSGRNFEISQFPFRSVTLIPCDFRVGSFSLAPNGRFLVFASSESSGMGMLYKLDIRTRTIRKLTDRPFYFKKLNQGERELYSGPEISPDSNNVAFAVHAVAGNDSDDLVGLAGPLAIMNLTDRRSSVLKSTEKVDNDGPAFANRPSWAPDGRRLPVAFEAGGATLDACGTQLRQLDDIMLKPFEEGVISPLTWFSNAEILFVWNKGQVSGRGTVFVLDLVQGRVTPGEQRLPVPPASLRDVIGADISKLYILLRHPGSVELFARSGELVRRWSTGEIRLRGAE